MIGIRQILVILGVILVIRLVGKILSARRNINEQQTYQNNQKAKQDMQKDVGKTTISKIDKKALKSSDYSSYEEID